jgi:hypothetical protein
MNKPYLRRPSLVRTYKPILIRSRAGRVPLCRADRSEAPLLTFRSDSEMSGRDFEETVKQEEARLRAVHPTTEDIPGCMTLFDDFLSCNSACLLRVPK